MEEQVSITPHADELITWQMGISESHLGKNTISLEKYYSEIHIDLLLLNTSKSSFTT